MKVGIISALALLLFVSAAPQSPPESTGSVSIPGGSGRAQTAPKPEAGVADAREKFVAKRDAYEEGVAKVVWTRAREIRVRNPAGAGDTLAVVVPLEAAGATAFAAADEAGRPIVTQADDLDGDGAADVVCFLLALGAGQERVVRILSGRGEVPPAYSDLRVREYWSGSWEPVRMQPTRSLGTTQHSTYISPTNRARARSVMDRLDRAVPMELIECDDFRLLIGRASGLIEGMRPGSIPKAYIGSFLREFVPGEPDMGAMKRRFAGPVRCGFEWPEVGRRVTVYRNGVIETAWDKTPKRMTIVACAYPYRYLQSGPEDAVRFSQMPERRRSLPGGARVCFFGRRDASLRVEAVGLKATDHQVWLDGGEIGWEVALDARDKKSAENPHERVGRLCADTYIAGGLHVTSWKSEGGKGAISYRIADLGEKALAASRGLVRVAHPGEAAAVPKFEFSRPRSPVSLALERTEITVNLLHPNRISGWELRPVTLARHNPQPAYFAARLENRSDREAAIAIALDAADWILEASVLYGRETLTHDGSKHRIVNYRHEEKLEPGGGSVRLVAPAGASFPLEIVVRPKEGTLGLLKGTLRWSGAASGSADLAVLVRPTIMFMPMYAIPTELGREYANVCWHGAPLMFDYRFYGGPTPMRRLWRIAARRDSERNGFWAMELMYLKDQLDAWKDPDSERCRKWTAQMLELVRDPEYAKYRVRINLHDEIWEAIGGYKDRVLASTEVVADLDRKLVMNSANAAWPSFQEAGIDKPFQYHVMLPNDIAELFYYCGRDARLREYARKLVEPRRALFKKWKADPACMRRAGTDAPRAIHSFWISAQLHVTRYEPVRRQCWWLRHNGIDSLLSWSFTGGGYKPYAGRILHLMVMPAGTAGRRGFLLTDRALAWMDMKEDMDLVTLVRLLREDAKDARKLAALDALALDASQKNAFEEARHHYRTALGMLRPDLAYLAARDLYRGPVKTEPLADLFEAEGVVEASKIPRAAVPLLRATGDRPGPSLDGVLDNAYLEQGVTLEMREAVSGGRPRAPTSVYVARDEEHLYVFYGCDEPHMAKLRMRVKERDRAVYSDDCVELFVDRAGDGKDLAHFAVNAAGVRYDSRSGPGKKWNPEYAVAALRGAESWSLEMRIPFAALGGPPKSGETWRVNFCRERYAVPELSAWSVTFGGFHSPERFGIVEFGKE